MKTDWKKKTMAVILAAMICAAGAATTVFAEGNDDNTTIVTTSSGDQNADQDAANAVDALIAAESEYVAELNGEKYKSLQDAVDAAKSGDTITILQDIELQGTVLIWGNKVTKLTLDMNGCTITPADNFVGGGTSKGAIEWLYPTVDGVPAPAMETFTVKNGTFRGFQKAVLHQRLGIGSSMVVENCNFEGCSEEGAVFLTCLDNEIAGSSATFTGCTFTDNHFVTQAANGGAINISKVETVTITDCSFKNNEASMIGGAIYAGGTNLTIDDSNFVDNSTVYNGGAICVADKSTAKVNNCTFEGNVAKSMGGAIHVQGTNGVSGMQSSLVVNGGSFTDNKAGYGGSFSVATNSCSMTVSGAEFSGNSATYYGGAIYAQDLTTVNVTGDITGHNAGYDGGAIYSNKATVTVNGNLTGNEAGRNGGAVCVYQHGLTVNGNITGNKAVGNGGGIYSSWTPVKVTGDITGNSAAIGGGVYVAQNDYGAEFEGKMDLTSACVYNNTASVSASDVFSGVNSLTILPATSSDWILSETGKAIDAWYQDGAASRWSSAASTDSLGYNAEGYRSLLEVRAAHFVAEEEPELPDFPDSEVSKPEVSEPDEEISEEETPLASAPVQDTEEASLVDAPEAIEDEDVPQVSAPQTGKAVGGAIGALALAAVAVIGLGKKRRK